MIKIHNEQQEETLLYKYLSPLAVWALAFGSAVGWGAFVMPGTTFLPIAGPWGSVLGLFIGAAIMMFIGFSYYYLMKRYPGPGGSYTFASQVLGRDHGFLCAWMLILTYAAIIWANSTALSLIVRYLFGDIFCFGLLYQLAGYQVYLGELLLSFSILAVGSLICIAGKRFVAYVQIICALLLFIGVSICFITAAVHRGGPGGIIPAFSSSDDPAVQVLTIVVLAPWAYIGFESVSHSTGEFKFDLKKSLPVIIAALVTGALVYSMLSLCAAMAVPDGYGSWSEYIGSLSQLKGIQALPTFHTAREAMGTAGPVLLGVAAFCGIMTGLIGHMTALSRIIYRMSEEKMMPRQLGQLSKRNQPARAIYCIAAVSSIIPFFGRTAISWIVDVTTIGATIVYAYVSICALIVGKRERKYSAVAFGIIGTVITVIFAVFYSLPDVRSQSSLAAESYLILIVWSIIGMFVFLALMKRDKTRRFGKSTIVWIILFCMILLASVSWINRMTVQMAADISVEVGKVHTSLAESAGLDKDNGIVIEANRYLTEKFSDFADMVKKNIYIFAALIMGSLAVIFRIFSIIKNREKIIEAERLIAEKNSRAKSTFLSNMSHDIRTPMNAITGYTALALEEKNLPDNLRVYLEKIDISGRQLLSLINDILDMSRIESGKMELAPEPTDLFAILDETGHIFDIQMKQKSLTFTLDHSSVKNHYAVCYKNRLDRILLNLISNAYKFTPSGGKVSVVLKELEAAKGQGTYELSVSDTGIGMSPEFAKHIFDAFERERSRTVDSIQGTGLGMAITKNFVEMMGGTILVKTEKGKGTTFIIRLQFPLSTKKEVHKTTEPSDKEKTDLSGVRILLTDDNPINREIATKILSKQGFEIETAENGKIAVEILEKADKDYYAAVLMDIQMPVMNGYDATRAIRALDSEISNIPIIAVTANTFEDDRKEAYESGMNAHITKPLKPAELVKTLSECISGKK